MQAKIYLIETEAEPMPKEEVAMVLHALPHKVEQAYNILSKSVQEKIQKILLRLYGDDSEAVGYVYYILYTIVVAVFLYNFLKNNTIIYRW